MKAKHLLGWLAGVALLAAGGCGVRVAGGGAAGLMAVEVAQAERTDLEADVAVSGTLAPAAAADVAPILPGRVAEVPVREGDMVRAGQVVLRLDAADIEAQVRQAGAAYENAVANLERMRVLFDQGAVPAQAYDQARLQAEVTRNQLDAAREQLKNTAVVAPIGGMVAERRVEPGEMAGPTAAALRIADVATLVISGTVDEGIVNRLRVGQPATVTVAAVPGRTFAGTLSLVNPVAAAGGRFTVKVDVPNADGALKSGMTASAVIRVKAAGVLAVPESAVVRQGGRPYVFVVEGSRVRQRPVQTGLTAGGRVEVTAGLQPGERVVAAGGESLADGQAVQVAGPEAAAAPGMGGDKR